MVAYSLRWLLLDAVLQAGRVHTSRRPDSRPRASRLLRVRASSAPRAAAQGHRGRRAAARDGTVDTTRYTSDAFAVVDSRAATEGAREESRDRPPRRTGHATADQLQPTPIRLVQSVSVHVSVEVSYTLYVVAQLARARDAHLSRSQ